MIIGRYLLNDIKVHKLKEIGQERTDTFTMTTSKANNKKSNYIISQRYGEWCELKAVSASP